MAKHNAQQTTEKLILSAEEGDAEAQFNLGVMYAQGQGVPQDDVQAVKWYRLAADQGVAQAQYNLGLSYMKGVGVEQSIVDAMMWLEQAADQGHTKSQITLGKLYGNQATSKAGGFFISLLAKRLTPDAMVKCLKWFYVAWMNGEDNAEDLIKQASSHATKKDIAHAQELARNWKPKK
jgi:TPR repeat protein